jgi:hypothetical protein
MPAIRSIIRDAEKNHNRMSSYILGIVNSAAFRMSRPESRPTTTDAGGRDQAR